MSFKFGFKSTVVSRDSDANRRLFQILGAATANARDAVTVLVLGCCNICLAEERSGRIGAEFCMNVA